MSFGFKVTSNNNNILVDEKSSIYYVPRYTVSQSAPFSEPRQDVGGYVGRVNIYIQFEHVIRSIEQPYLYLTQDIPQGIPVDGERSYWWGWRTYDSTWLSRLSWACTGSPGNWTGMTVHINQHSWWSLSVTPPDFRHVFVPVACGGSPPIGTGMCVFDETGKVVFNSNDNFVYITSKSSTWTYRAQTNYHPQHRPSGDSMYYIRYFTSPALPTSYDDLLRAIPGLTVRREQGSICYAGLYQVNPVVERYISFGRWDQAGVEAQTPVIWVRPVQPRIYTAI